MKIASYDMVQTTAHLYEKNKRRLVSRTQVSKPSFQDAMTSATENDRTKQALKANYDLIEALMAYLSKEDYDFKDPRQLSGSDARKFMVIIESESYESEQMTFSSEGLIKTSDGQTIDFTYTLNMSRESYERKLIQIGSRGRLDPLILNLDNKGASFGDKKIHIDLDLDGHIDSFSMVNHGSGFLVLDKNNNGIVDDGHELFGPKTDNGFKELQAYDLDNNHWIDSNDLVFDKLKIWTIDAKGKEVLVGMKEADVGAINLDGIQGKYNFENEKALIVNSSIFLRNDGRPGAIHEIKV